MGKKEKWLGVRIVLTRIAYNHCMINCNCPGIIKQAVMDASP
jgi:hypothetical protein